ncbi:MAG TPA: endonuclease/exonuclease/phosphatase family protein [Marmoricola sp.]|nr:endonuclease/exonuclease/phosphatase family protein [Marmoricola sp.]
MVRTPARTPRAVLTVGTVLLLAFTLLGVTSPAEAAHRPPPRALRTTAADQSSLTVRWHWVRKAPGYRLRWSLRRSMAGSHRLATAKHSARITGLAPNTRYFVQVAVAARKGHGRRLSPWSRKLVRRTPPAPCPTMGNIGDQTPVIPNGQPADLRVASFNIRTMNLDSSAYPSQRWANRADRVASLLLGAGTTRNAPTAAPDVIALQEANQSYAKFPTLCTNQMIDLRNRLDAGSGRHFEATSLNPSSSVGTRILFDTTRLRLERAGSVLLAPVGTDHPHLAWAVFQVRDGGQRFFFGSVHLAPGEGADANAVRNSEWDRLLAVLTDPAYTEGLPVVLGGDFNSARTGGPDGTAGAAPTHLPRMWAAGVGDMLLGDTQDPTDLSLTVADARPKETVNANCMSFNAFRIAQHCDADTPHVTPQTDQPDTLIGKQIDYLFASNQLVVKSWEVVLDLDSMDYWLGTIPSDHNLLRATVTLPPQ